MILNLDLPQNGYDIILERGALFRAKELLDLDRRVLVVTDSGVPAEYSQKVASQCREPVVVTVPEGEASKCFSSLEMLCRKLLECGFTRTDCVVAVGGGVVGDLSGFAAASYLRGNRFIQIPTTLLAAVDSSVGGKTAVDMGKVKNGVGAFYQPEAVLVDSTFLHTLPEREIRCGLGEIVKYGGLNGDIFNRLRSNIRQLSSLDFLAEITPDCIAHKADVVRRDEREANERKSLNMGHTTAHALELYYGNLSHGEFVLIGMYYELKIALDMGMVSPDYAEQLNELIVAVLGAVPKYADVSQAVAFAKLDKKNSKSDEVSMIVPTSHGQYAELKLAYEKYLSYMQQFANQP